MRKEKRNSIINALICVSLLLAFTLGCKQISELQGRRDRVGTSDIPNGSGSGKNAGTTGNNGGAADSGLRDKSNLYITECHNKYSNRVMTSFERYQSWIKNIEQGPTGKESIVYGLYDVNGDGKDCVEAISKAKALEPPLPETEEAADRYSEALQMVITQIRTVYSYYDQEDYKDDNFQKGKDAHQGLLKAFRDFQTANKEFNVQIDKLEDDVAQQQLDALRDDPSRKFDYLMVESGVKSKKIAMLVQNTEYSQIKVEDLQSLIDDFDKNTADMKAEGSKNPMASTYFSACDEFLKASKELARRIRDKKPFTDFERRQVGTMSGWMVEGSPDKVINKYNDLIQRRSFMRF